MSEAIIWVTLPELVRKLHIARCMLCDAKAALDAQQAAFENEHQSLIDAFGVERARVAQLDAECRALAIVEFQRTGDLTPAPGVKIQMRTELQYDESAAFAWAKEKQMALVPESLDVKAFEKIAKVTALPFVDITTEPLATIASDLSAIVAREK